MGVGFSQRKRKEKNLEGFNVQLLTDCARPDSNKNRQLSELFLVGNIPPFLCVHFEFDTIVNRSPGYAI